MLYPDQETEEESYLSKILGMFSGAPKTLDEANYRSEVNRPLKAVRQPDPILIPTSNLIEASGLAIAPTPNLAEAPEQNFMQYAPAGRDVVFRNRSRTVQSPDEAAIQNAKRNYISNQPEYTLNLPTNMLAPYGTGMNRSSVAKESMDDQNRNNLGELAAATIPPVAESQAVQNAQPPQGNANSIFDSISNTFKDISKSASETFKSDSFREGLGGILVSLGAGIQGQDASKALERYNNSLLSDKEEARRKVIEEERRQKNNPASTWNLTYREMFKKYVPGVEKMMGDSFNNMTEEMLKSSYPMIANGIKNMTERELSDPKSGSSIDAVNAYNELIKSFGDKIKPLEAGKYSASQVENFKNQIDNVIRFSHQEDQNKFNQLKLAEDVRQFGLRQQQEDKFQNQEIGLKREKLAFEKADASRRAAMERERFNYQKQQDAERKKLIQQKMQIQQASVYGLPEKEQRRLLEKYPSGIVLSSTESKKLQDKQDGYSKMKSALDNLEQMINKYGAPMSPTSNGYAEINSAWSQYVAAIKEAEELGALDIGVSKLANETLPNPTKINPLVRISGGEKGVRKNTLSILSNMRNQYKTQYAKNTASYGFNPEISADSNTRYMDEYTNPNTSPERQDQIYESVYRDLGYTPKLFRVYAENYVSRRQLFTGVR